ncbi:MAG TPA: alpha/beta hydrolase [Candidatus Acidoferrum sp.]|jgi:esterase/lipase superfamily enzyme|nr:alpha/beta hydrolase [Candidatus Acidoferrum sp.]
MPGLVVGLHIGTTEISGGLVTLKGELVEFLTAPTLADEGFETSCREVLGAIERLVHLAETQRIIGIGVCVSGEVYSEPSLLDWREVLTQQIREQFSLPARLVGQTQSRTDAERVLFAANLFLGDNPPSVSKEEAAPRHKLNLLAVGILSVFLAFLILVGLYFRARSPQGSVPCDPTQAGFCRVQVFFATDRKPSGQSIPAKYFGDERGDDNGPLTFGTLDVSIPARHRTGHIEEPLPLFKQDPTHDLVVISLKVAPESQFFSSLTNAVNASQNKEALVFIHGYDVTFDEAARRIAQLTWDLGFRGVPILYSWPSKGTKLMYPADEASALWAVPHLEQFLTLVARRSGATTVHIVAHSLGNRTLIYALQQITRQHSATPRFRQIVLAAPDIDVGIFRQLADTFPSVAERVTIYASAHDKALGFSKILHRSASVGGQSQPSHLVRGVDVIDASAMSEDLLDFDHNYYAANVAVLEDMGYVIRMGLPPEKRALLDPHPSTGIPIYWSFRH